MAGRRRSALWAAALLVALACGAAAGLSTSALVLHSRQELPQTSPRNASDALVLRGDGAVELRLCECERATGPPNGLSCDKEGWFISSFERQGQWVAGGGFVPLSHAICCRPCLPAELPPDPSGRIPPGQRPLAVISLGCHASTDTLPTRCELGANSFVAGYAEAVKVFSQGDTYYPTNTASCCTPALLLENGDAWELERCGCHDSHDPDFPVSCGGTNTDELLLGYIFFRLSPLGHVVPVGPAQCCRACLSSTVHPMSQCDDLNGCSGHGVCNMRRCECFDGWAGADCSLSVRSAKAVPPWAIALIVLSSCALAGMLIGAAGYALQTLGEGAAPGSEAGDGEERQPLLLRIDADDAGSVGSADTTDAEDEVDVEEVERRVNRTIERLEHSAGEGAGPALAAGAGAEGGAAAADIEAAAPAEAQRGGDTPRSCADPEQQSAAGAAAAVGEAEGEVETPATAEDSAAAAGAAAAAAAADGGGGGGEIEDPVKPPRGPGAGLGTPEGPLAMVDCVVCMSRPVQVVVVPCGHVCCCRRCSRRLQRCPVCRKEIARRQRLYV